MRAIAPAGIVIVALACLTGHARAAGAAGQALPVAGGQSAGVGPPPGAGQVPVRDRSRATGTSRLRGRVVAADTGQPLRRATVRATSPEVRESVSTMTDRDGLFEFKDLPAGRYTVTASKGSYATLAFGQTRPNEAGRPIAVGDNQTIEKIDLRLPRGGVITGVITDEFGEPVPDAVVMPLRQQFLQGRRRLMPAGRAALSNDIGGYRLFGLSPGAYYLSVALQMQAQVGVQERTDVRTGYAPTYYPGTAELASAQRLTVGVGQALADINLTLVAMPTAQVSGTIVGPNGDPVTAGAVIAQLRGSVMVGAPPAMGQIRPDGTFTMSGVPPGEYVLSSISMGTGGSGTVSRAVVSVNGADIAGIQLMPSVPLTLAGRLVLDGGSTSGTGGPTVQLQFIDLNGEELGPGGLFNPPVTVGADLTFEAKVHPGRIAVRAMTDPRWQLKSVRQDGVEVTDRGLDVRPGAELTSIEVEVTMQRQEVTGAVSQRNGQPATNYTVVVFAQDRERWGLATRYVSMARPDQEGRFVVRSLPPGDYYAVAVESLEPGGATDPDFLDSVIHAATGLSLNAGETKSLDLRLADPR